VRWLRGLLVVFLLMVGGAQAVWAAQPQLEPVVLPRDHGAHPGFEVEWWYTAGTVADASGREFFWFATVWAGEGLLVAKLNVVDLQADQVVLTREYVEPDTLTSGQTTIDADGFEFGWQPAGPLGVWSVDAPLPNGGGLQLSLRPTQPYMLNGLDGIVAQGPGSFSDYYSGPRLAAVGTLELGGDSIPVSGQGWFDHQWGNFAFDPDSLHWNWFACQFQDGADLMLYQFITRTGQPTGVQESSFVSPLGTVTHPLLFTVTPLLPTIQPPGATGIYPLRWRLEVPSAGLDITLASRARNQFIANRIVPNFWESAASITNGEPGSCIVESTRESVLSGF